MDIKRCLHSNSFIADSSRWCNFNLLDFETLSLFIVCVVSIALHCINIHAVEHPFGRPLIKFSLAELATISIFH